MNTLGGVLIDNPPGIGGLQNKIYVWHADSSTVDIFDPTSAGLNSAIAAAVSGDTVWLPSVTISGNHTIPANIRVIGISRGAVLSGTITVAGYLDHVTITGNLVINAATSQVEFVWVDHTGSGVNGVTMTAGVLRDAQITMRSAGAGDWGLYLTGGNDITRVVIDQVGGSSKGAYIDYSTIGVYYCKFGGTLGAQVENALEIGWCWFDGSGANGLIHTTTRTAYLHHCYFFGTSGDGLNVTNTGLTIADCSWDTASGLSFVTIGPGDRAAGPSDVGQQQIVANPHAGNVIDECTARAYVDGKIYWSSHRAQGTSTALGYEYAWNTLALSNAELQNEAGKAGWQSAYNPTDGLIYVVGQVYADTITYRAAIWTIDPASGTVTTHVLNAAGEATGDTNELIAILDDGTQIVAGERAGGGLTTGSDFPNGGGLWTIPKATIGTVSSYTRVYEDTDSPTREWHNLAKRGSTYYALLVNYTNAKYVIQHSTNLTAWTVDVDGTALSLNDIRGYLIHHAGLNLICGATVNSSRQVVLRVYDGSSWVATTFANLVIPSSGGFTMSLCEFGSDLVLFISDSTAHTHDVYLISDLTGTPFFTRLFRNLAGSTWFFPVTAEPNIYYGTQYPGGLNKIELWGRGGVSSGGTVTSVATGTGLTGGPITLSGTISDANTGVAAATYGDTGNVPQIAVNAQGRITSAVNVGLPIPINVYNETQTADGVNTTYYLINYAAPGTIRVYIDGIRQPASDDDAPTDVVTFTIAPLSGALLMFDYEMELA